MALNADQILKHAGVLDTRQVEVPAWRDENGDDVVIVRAMTSREVEVHQSRITASKAVEKGHAAAMLLQQQIVDEDGRRVFTPEQVNQIAELGWAQLSKLVDAVNDLSGFGAEAEESAKGESEAAPTSNSASE